MSFILTREQLYELVWSEAMQSLGKKIGMSDVGLAKHLHVKISPFPFRNAAIGTSVSPARPFRSHPCRLATLRPLTTSNCPERSRRSSASGLPVGPATTVSSKRN